MNEPESLSFALRLASQPFEKKAISAAKLSGVSCSTIFFNKGKRFKVELETTRDSCKQGMEQTVFNENERFTQIQWDMEELRKQCMEMESLLNSIKDEKAHIETTYQSLVQETQMLLQQIDDLRDKFENLHKEHEELEVLHEIYTSVSQL